MAVALLGVIAALLSGGAAGLYLARAKRSQVVADASEHAVGTLEKVMVALEKQVQDCTDETARLEAQVAREMATNMRLERQLRALCRWIDAHGGDSREILDA